MKKTINQITIFLGLYKNGKRYKTITARKKSKILTALRLENWENVYLKVTYALGRDYFNAGPCTTLQQAVRMLNSFTERETCSHCCGV